MALRQPTLHGFLGRAGSIAPARAITAAMTSAARAAAVTPRSMGWAEFAGLFASSSRIVACVGSRVLTSPGDEAAVREALAGEHGKKPFACLVTGGATGPDSFGAEWALAAGVPVREYLPEWSFGNGAGMQRNALIVAHASLLMAFPAVNHDKSRGTRQTMVTAAGLANMTVKVWEL